MKQLYWFTGTNFDSAEGGNFSFDLTAYIEIFAKHELWNKSKYRTEYRSDFSGDDLRKIRSLKLHFHSPKIPYSNLHSYENILNEYFETQKIEKAKIRSSAIEEAHKIAVVEVEFDSQNKVIDELIYEQEKDLDQVIGNLREENHQAWIELSKVKSIICEYLQFFMFNLHLNFLTQNYSFSFNDKANPIGFTIVSEHGSHYYSTDRIELLSHYVLYDRDRDNLKTLMEASSKFWCGDFSPIHFFLDALKGNHVTSTSFIKLVFALESFFTENLSNDFISLTAPLIISKNVGEMKMHRKTIRNCFKLRNKIVHGRKLVNFNDVSVERNSDDHPEVLFFALKNVITQLFFFFMNNDLLSSSKKCKINHELIFDLLPLGLITKSKKLD